MYTLVRYCFYFVSLVLFSSAAIGLFGYVAFQGSLPTLEGTLKSSALESGVRVDRDINGVVSITSDSRNDSAFALGYVHAQERFFQMDLLRRRSAGELSELFGATSLEQDIKNRKYRFRALAESVVINLTENEKRILKIYTKGVNQGLSDLSVRPFEYLMLKKSPVAWQEVDTLLVIYSLYLDLQDSEGGREQTMAILRSHLDSEWFEFITPQGGEWDAPISGNSFPPLAKIPDSQWPLIADTDFGNFNSVIQQIGSSSWAIGSKLSATNNAILSNDMHFKLQVPNIWFRASWKVEDRNITGATIPGVPALIIGSNEHVAWGLTNSYGDWSDIVVLETNSSKMLYQTPEGWENFKIYDEVIRVSGQDSKRLTVKYTRWGPVVGTNELGKLIALKWVALEPLAANIQILNLEKANDVDQALTIAANSGLPHQNFTVVDKSGATGWTILGKIPNRVGFDGTNSESWSDGDKYWQGFLAASQYPSIRTEADGKLWTANNRTVFGSDLQKIGNGGFAIGARAQQIRNTLQSNNQFTEIDMLELQLDDRAVFLGRWHKLMLTTVKAMSNTDLNNETISLLENWQGRASSTSVGYLMVKRFRERVISETIGKVYTQFEDNYASFDPTKISQQVEYPVWQLVIRQPEHLIPINYESWLQFFQTAVDDTLNALTNNSTLKLANQTWGKVNKLHITHPLSDYIPGLEKILDMHQTEMSGDIYMPRIQNSEVGSSQRMVVSPGNEESGIFSMPGSQAGHPLSPYYRRGHEKWLADEDSGFLPEKSEWNMTFWPVQLE